MLKLAIPLLHVSDSAQAEEFYCSHLGFHRQFAYCLDDSRADPCYLGLSRDGVSLHLSSFAGDGVAGGVGKWGQTTVFGCRRCATTHL